MRRKACSPRTFSHSPPDGCQGFAAFRQDLFVSERLTMRRDDTPKSAAANRRPAGQSDGLGEFQRDCCRRSASPAAVAELGRCWFNCAPSANTSRSWTRKSSRCLPSMPRPPCSATCPVRRIHSGTANQTVQRTGASRFAQIEIRTSWAAGSRRCAWVVRQPEGLISFLCSRRLRSWRMNTEFWRRSVTQRARRFSFFLTPCARC